MSSKNFDAPFRAQNATDVHNGNVELVSATTHAPRKTGISRRIGTLAVAASVAATALVAAPAALQTSTASAATETAADTTATAATSTTAATAAKTTTTAATTTATKAVTKTVKKTKASIKLKFTKKSWTKGKKPGKLTVTVKAKGKAATGKVKIYDGSKRIKTLTLKKGKASYTFSKKLSSKKHTITVKYIPSGASKKVAKTTSKKTKVNVKKSASQKIVAEAKKYVGVRYVSGGSSPSRGFDCSGFTSYVYKKAVGKPLPRTSSAQRYVGKTVSKKNAQPGDIIWSPGHVAIYLGNNKIIDAPRPGKTIQVRTMWQSNAKFIRVSA